MSISAVVHTFNEANNLDKCLQSLKWVDETIIIDMNSSDNTIEIAKKYNAKIYFHKYTGYVESARNFGINKANSKWILIVDADEIITSDLKQKITSITNEDKYDFVSIPRKNFIFNKWIRHTGWWPDHKVRLFKKGYVTWSIKIHESPYCRGKALILPSLQNLSIVHNNYINISHFIEKLNRYTDKHAERLLSEGYLFKYSDILIKPMQEFFSRFYKSEGYKDGLYGFVLSFLMSFYFFVVYIKIWENFKKNANEKYFLIRVNFLLIFSILNFCKYFIKENLRILFKKFRYTIIKIWEKIS